MKCVFCDIDFSKIENTIIYEGEYFYVLPSVGALVDGYVLIVSKRHVESSICLNQIELNEYKYLINKFQNIFKKIYGKMPIVFEHGTFDKYSASSVVHAHTHIVNVNFKNEKDILEKYNFFEISDFNLIDKSRNYIKYINGDKIYVTYDFPFVSQLMRILIADEIGISDKYDWKSEKFISNIVSTIEKLKGE